MDTRTRIARYIHNFVIIMLAQAAIPHDHGEFESLSDKGKEAFYSIADQLIAIMEEQHGNNSSTG